MVETSHHFSSNVQQAYVSDPAGSYLITAELYVRGAQLLAPPSYEIPRLTLLLFALELALKAYLLDTGTPENMLRQINVRHDLKELYDLALRAGLPGNPDIVAVINSYRKDHKDHSFRYGSRAYIDLADPERAVHIISATVTEIGKLLKREL